MAVMKFVTATKEIRPTGLAIDMIGSFFIKVTDCKLPSAAVKMNNDSALTTLRWSGSADIFNSRQMFVVDSLD